MSGELKACPFCGGEAEGLSCISEYWVECKECGDGSRLFPSAQEATAAWNRRAPVRVKLPEIYTDMYSRKWYQPSEVIAALKAQGVEVE